MAKAKSSVGLTSKNALHDATLRGDVTAMIELLDTEVDIDARDEDGLRLCI